MCSDRERHILCYFLSIKCYVLSYLGLPLDARARTRTGEFELLDLHDVPEELGSAIVVRRLEHVRIPKLADVPAGAVPKIA